MILKLAWVYQTGESLINYLPIKEGIKAKTSELFIYFWYFLVGYGSVIVENDWEKCRG